MKIYLASYLGFSPEHDCYLDRVKERLRALGAEVLDPWEQTGFSSDIERALAMGDYRGRVKEFARIAAGIGAANERMIREADAVLGVLDGPEVDSGTASEIGFAAALGKRCYGLRTDFRNCGDFDGIPINLQILHFIESSGGRLFRKIGEITI